jgi:hypothetical protein
MFRIWEGPILNIGTDIQLDCEQKWDDGIFERDKKF